MADDPAIERWISRREFLRGSALAGIVATGQTAADVLRRVSRRTDRTPARTPGASHGLRRPRPTKLRVRTTETGTRFVDEQGRVVVLRGVNVVDKSRQSRPYPRSEIEDSDVRRLVAWGFNFVRLGLHWSKLTPRPPGSTGDVSDVLDEAYLDRIHDLVRRFGDHGIYVLLDMHQDLYSHVFTGDGAPAWAVHDEGFPFIPTKPWWTRYLQPAVLTAFDNFWQNSRGIQETFARAWRAVADRLGDEPNVAGYDLFNEPAPGLATLPDFETRWLADFSNRVVDRIRSVDPTTPVWVEPAVYTGGGLQSRLRGVTDPADNLALSFHAYPELFVDSLGTLYDGTFDLTDLWEIGYRLVVRNALAASRRLDAVPVMTEFGARQDGDNAAAAVDATTDRLLGWAYWQYKPWSGRPSGWLYEDDQVSENLPALLTPYPQAVAGRPIDCRYDRTDRTLEFRYRPDPDVDADTVLVAPARLYDGEFEVSCSSDAVVARGPDVVRVRAAESTSDVTVRIAPDH